MSAHIILAATVVVAGTLALLVLLGRNVKQHFIYFPARLAIRGRPQSLPLGVHYTRVATAMQDTTLAVYYRKGWPFLIFTHGTAGCCEDMLYMFETIDPSWGLIMWDYQGYGRSGGRVSESNTAWDLGAVVAWTQTKFQIRRRRDIILWSRSLGTNVTLHYINYVAHPKDWPVALILVTPFVRISSVLGPRVGRHMSVLIGRLLGDMEAAPGFIRYCQRNRQVLILASREDCVTPWVSAEELYRVGNGRVRLRELAGSHQGLYERWELVADFLDEVMQKKTRAIAFQNNTHHDQPAQSDHLQVSPREDERVGNEHVSA